MNKKINLYIAKGFLYLALSKPYSEEPIENYIKFMDSLKEADRKDVLLNPEITKLIDRLNK